VIFNRELLIRRERNDRLDIDNWRTSQQPSMSLRPTVVKRARSTLDIGSNGDDLVIPRLWRAGATMLDDGLGPGSELIWRTDLGLDRSYDGRHHGRNITG